jgi:hypothetical protein
MQNYRGVLSHFILPILVILVFLITPWFWRIGASSLWLAFLVIACTFFIALILSFASIKRIQIIMLFFLSFGVIFLIRDAFDFKLGGVSDVDRRISHYREIFFSEGLGRLFLNKVSLVYYRQTHPYIQKYSQNIFYNLDLNQYFFNSHPRERGDAYEFEKFLPIFLPFFLFGLSLNLKNKFILTYSILMITISGFISLNYFLGPVILLPVICLFTAIGLKESLLVGKKLLIK